MGGDVELAAKVGKDPFGQHLIDVMDSFGVNTKWMLQDENYFTTFAFVSLMENGERDFYFNRGADGQLNRGEVDAIDLKEFSIIHFGSATAFLPGPLQIAYQSLLQKSLQQGIFISFDPNYRSLLFQNDKQSFIDQSWNFLDCCNFFKVSEEEAMMLTGRSTVTDAANDFLSRSNSVFAITIGKDGAMLGVNGKIETIPGIKIKPIDTTGAGDAFVGAVLYQLEGRSLAEIRSMTLPDWEKIVSNGNKAGARTCEYMGAMEAFKYLSSEIFK